MKKILIIEDSKVVNDIVANELKSLDYSCTQVYDFENAVKITCFDVDLYFILVEKITVYEGNRLVVTLLDGTEVAVSI